MTRADAWIHFAGNGILGNVSTADAAGTADALLAEFDKRFQPAPDGGHLAEHYVPDTFEERKDVQK